MKQSNFVPILLMLGLPSVWALVVLYNRIPAQEPWKSEWKSAQQCYDEHIKLADGDYPLSGDDTSKLMVYCEKVYKICDFSSEPSRINWKFFIVMPPRDRRDQWLDQYFSSTQLCR